MKSASTRSGILKGDKKPSIDSIKKRTRETINISVHLFFVRALVANNDGGQGWIIANIPYALVSVIIREIV